MKIMIIERFIQMTDVGCFVRRKFHIYCPGCGGTRAVIALLKFDFRQSLYYNPIVILLCLYVFLMIIFKITEIIYPEKQKHYRERIILGRILMIFIVSFAIIRNYLFVFWGIDMLGNFR